MTIELRATNFDPFHEIRNYQAQMNAAGSYGASAFFIGTMRDHNAGESVTSMQLEHYPGMTEKHLQDIAGRAAEQWPILDSLIIHRVGMVTIAEPIVLVAVWSAHRAAAFDACRFIMEDLKSRAPFWKKETTASGERWVECNTPGYSTPDQSTS